MRTIDSQTRRSPRLARSTSSDSSSGRSTTAASTPAVAVRFHALLGALRGPDLALDELDRVAGRVANVERATARRPGVLVLDLDAVLAEALSESGEVGDRER